MTGGTMSSIYAGPWDQFAYLGVHLALESRVLTERYADVGQVGLFTWLRGSIRYGNPQSFSRTIGILTT
jgi:predicted phage gp36 major capsid-like protein